MRITRLVAGLATAGLLVSTPLVAGIGAGPASAATTLTSSVNVDAIATGKATYGDKLDITGQTVSSNGTTVDSGTVYLQISTPGNPAYTTIASSDTASYFTFDNVKVESNASYQVVYGGGTQYNYPSGTDTVTGSTSAPQSIMVERKVSLKTDGLKVIGKIQPKGKTKVKILRKSGKKFVKYRTFKTAKSGHFTFRAPNRTGFKFKLVIAANKKFVATKAGYTVI